MNDTTRVALATSTALSSPSTSLHPDAELLRVCATFGALERQINAVYAEAPPIISCAEEAERDRTLIEPLKEQQEPLLARAMELQAVTVQGLLARVEMLAAYAPHKVAQHQTSGCEARLTSALLRDGLALRALPPIDGPDAELIALLDKRNALERKHRRLWRGYKETGIEAEKAFQRDFSNPVLEQIATLDERLKKLTAQTTDGLLARVEAIFVDEPSAGICGQGMPNEAMLRALHRDVKSIKRMPRSASLRDLPAVAPRPYPASSQSLAEAVAAHAEAHAAYCREEDAPEGGSEERAYIQALDAVSKAKATSLPDCLAKIGAIMTEAQAADGSLTVEGNVAAAWCWEVVRDMAQIMGIAGAARHG